MRPLTSDGLQVGGEHKQLDEAQTERGVVVFPDNSGDEEDLAITGKQQGPEEEAELRGLSQHRPQKEHRSTAESQELYVGGQQTSGTSA